MEERMAELLEALLVLSVWGILLGIVVHDVCVTLRGKV